MKIVFVRASLGSTFAISPPLSFGYLSSSLKANGYSDISFIDGALWQMTPDQAADEIEKGHPPDIIGIQVYTGSHTWTREFISRIKKGNTGAKIIVGGPHITALRELALEYLDADFGVAGEGEIPIVEFAGYIEGRIKNPQDVTGLIYRENGKYLTARKEYGLLEDINSIPFPDWELLKPQNYFERFESATLPLRGSRPAILLSSRGCPYKCTFCASGLVNKNRIRFRSPENIIAEMEYLKANYNIDEIMFTDDNLTMNLNRAEEIFDLMIQRKINLPWRAPNGIRLDRLNENLITRMAASGCYSVGGGIETGNKNMMKRIRKKLDLDRVKEKVELLQRNRISVSGFFMCGLIGETEKEVNDSIRFALSVPFSRIQVSNYTPYPGSADFEEIFRHPDEKKYHENIMRFQKNGFIPDHPEILPLRKTIKLQRKFTLKFYLRLSVILSMLRDLNLKQIRSIYRHPMIRRMLGFKQDLYSKANFN